MHFNFEEWQCLTTLQYVDEEIEPIMREILDLQNHILAEKEAIMLIKERLEKGEEVVSFSLVHLDRSLN